MKGVERLGWLLCFLAGTCMPALAQDQRAIVQGGTLVDVRSGSLTPDTVVVVRGDEIESVFRKGERPLPEGTVVDAQGKYILPGLIDLHVHYKEWAPELYLNHGVTTVVDLGNAHEWIKAQKEGIDRGLIPGPRLFHGTNNLEGPPSDPQDFFMRPHMHILPGPEEARTAMREYIRGRIDAVKVYDGLSVETLKAIVAEAGKPNIPVIGHFKDVRIAAEVGAHGIEHTEAVANAVVNQQERERARQRVRKGYSPPVHAFIDFAKVPEIVRLMVDKGLYLNPTLRGNWQGDRALREKKFHYEDFDLLINDWRLRYVPLGFRLAVLKEYQEIRSWHWSDLTDYERDLFHQGYENTLRLVKMFADAGGKLYAGTDSANMSTPGLSLHQELELLVEAGVTPLQALQAATIHPAKLMRMEDRMGILESGKVGDVLVLEANPLENIRNTRKIAAVISRGKLLDRQYHADFKNPIPKNDPEDSSHYFPPPEVRWVSPEALAEGAENVALTVRGTGFFPYSIVQLQGTKLKTEYVNAFELQASVPSELLKPGTHAVRVENPDFAVGTVYARGASHLVHLGLRDPVSNPFMILVKYKGGAPVLSHPRESTVRP